MSPPGTQDRPLRFEIWCRVVDNLGDAGVCWRLARQLGGELGLQVVLWIDAPATLARIEPRTRPGAVVDGVEIRAWPRHADPARALDAPPLGAPPLDAPPLDAAADGAGAQMRLREATARTVHVSAFGCPLPASVRGTLSPQAPCPPQGRPLWINLEYLSAEDWVEGCHGLASTKPDDGAVEHFYYPGFTASTGGLLREQGLAARRERFLSETGQGRQWLAARGLAPDPGERLVSLFCYPDAPVEAWLRLVAVGQAPARVLLPAGVAEPQAEALLGRPLPVGSDARLGALALARFPMLPQDDYDRLLWSCDLNFVRGEDSWIRAHWAGRPFVWQPYPQDPATRSAKLDAFLARMAAVAGPVDEAAGMMRAWCLPGGGALAPAWARFDAALPRLAGSFRRWASHLGARPDLARGLVAFCLDRL